MAWLARAGSEVVLTARSEAKGQEAVDQSSDQRAGQRTKPDRKNHRILPEIFILTLDALGLAASLF
jgi:hypothetical protein